MYSQQIAKSIANFFRMYLSTFTSQFHKWSIVCLQKALLTLSNLYYTHNQESIQVIMKQNFQARKYPYDPILARFSLKKIKTF